MLRRLLVGALAFGFASSCLMAESTAGLTAAEIINKNVTARGGLKAWRAVQTLTESGNMGAGGDNRQPQAAAIPTVKRPGKQQMKLPQSPRLAEEAKLPFTLDLERGRKVRLELQFHGQTAIQVYDGANGWKVRPYLNRMEVESFTEDELHKSALQAELDGPLVDYAAKGTAVALEGTEKVNDRDTYRLKLTMKDGHSVHVWIDAKTFLETKIEGTPRKLDGLEHPVEIYFSDYRTVDGLQIPFLLETKVLPLKAPGKVAIPGAANAIFPVEKIVIDKVEVNPKLDASLFSKPVIQTAALTKPN
jgi:outer membrane lipoprotein-sorting protein